MQRTFGAFTALGALAALTFAANAAAEDVRVFILAGQSNMVGYGEAAELSPEQAYQPDVLYDFFNPASRAGGGYVGATSIDWEPLTPKGDGPWYGPEITFGQEIEAALGGERAAIVKVAAGGTNIVEHWGRGLPADPEAPEKSQLYHALMGSLDSASYGPATGNDLLYPLEPTRLDAALARLDAAGHTHQIGCFVWVQGENEAGWSAAFDYESTLSGLIAALREDLGRPDLPIVLGRTAAQTGAAQGGHAPDANLAAVRAAQEAVAAADPKVDFVDMDDLPGAGDNLHFTGEGYRMLGARLATSCAAMLEDVPSMTTSSSGPGPTSTGSRSSSTSGPTNGSATTGGGTSSGGGASGNGASGGGGCSVKSGQGVGAAGWGIAGVVLAASRTRKKKKNKKKKTGNRQQATGNGE